MRCMMNQTFELSLRQYIGINNRHINIFRKTAC